MVRAVSVDDGLLERHSQLQRTKAFESGLLLAQVGSKGDTLLRLVPTPEQDDCKASTVDADWMLEHAVQVSRMLPGGVVVMGCYVFAPTAKFVPYESRLQAVLGAIAKRLPQSMSEPQSVLLLLPTDSKKPSCRACSAATARLQPIELKTTPVPPQLVCFSCDWAIDLTLALQPSPSSTHASQLSAQLGALEATLAASFETIDGQRPFSGHTVAQLSRAVGTTVQPHRVEFFSPVPMASAPVKGARALVRVVGVVHGRAFALLKADVAAVIDDLRRDLIQSLRARVPLLLDQLAEEDEETDNEDGGMADKQNFDLDKEASYALPRRVHIDVGDGLSLCDFLGSEEEPSDVAERFSALLGQDIANSDGDITEEFLGPESAALVSNQSSDARFGRASEIPSGSSTACATRGAANADARAGRRASPTLVTATDQAKRRSLMLPVLASLAFAFLAIALAMASGQVGNASANTMDAKIVGLSDGVEAADDTTADDTGLAEGGTPS